MCITNRTEQWLNIQSYTLHISLWQVYWLCDWQDTCYWEYMHHCQRDDQLNYNNTLKFVPTMEVSGNEKAKNVKYLTYMTFNQTTHHWGIFWNRMRPLAPGRSSADAPRRRSADEPWAQFDRWALGAVWLMSPGRSMNNEPWAQFDRWARHIFNYRAQWNGKFQRQSRDLSERFTQIHGYLDIIIWLIAL